MKGLFFSTALGAVLFGMTGTAAAGHGHSYHHGHSHHHSHHHHHGVVGVPSYYVPAPYYAPPVAVYASPVAPLYRPPVYHDTTHLDYHAPSIYRHRGHYHVAPGHYDLHQSGHWDD